MSILKRQREQKKAEKAQRKRAKKHGFELTPNAEPRPTVDTSALRRIAEGGESDDRADTRDEEPEPATVGSRED